MMCPNCNKMPLDLTERFWDSDDCKTLIGEEHFFCPVCFSTFSRKVVYSLVLEGELEE